MEMNKGPAGRSQESRTPGLEAGCAGEGWVGGEGISQDVGLKKGALLNLASGTGSKKNPFGH